MLRQKQTYLAVKFKGFIFFETPNKNIYVKSLQSGINRGTGNSSFDWLHRRICQVSRIERDCSKSGISHVSARVEFDVRPDALLDLSFPTSNLSAPTRYDTSTGQRTCSPTHEGGAVRDSGVHAVLSETSAMQTLSSGDAEEGLPYIDELGIPLEPSFDVTTYINARFPDESSLSSGLEAYLDTLQIAISRTDTHLSDLVRAQTHATRAASAPLASSAVDLAALQTRLKEVSVLAAGAERETLAAIAPARPLHFALRNTSAVSSALAALVALDEGVGVLEAAAATRSFELLATDLSVFANVRSALVSLDTHAGNSPPGAAPGLLRLPTLRARAGAATDALRQTVLQHFREHAPAIATNAPGRETSVRALQTACTVAAAIGDDLRSEIIAAHVASRIAAFHAAFMADRAGLSGVEKRFGWLRRELRGNWPRAGEKGDRDWGRVYPDEWGVASKLARALVGELRDWTARTLDAGADRDVAVMVSSLSKTKSFEDEMDRRFGGSVRFGKCISESYGPWMGAFVQKEDAHLAAVVKELLRDETWKCEDGTVLNSAKQLFLAVKKSMKMCAALDARQPLYSLHAVFRKHLSNFSATLVRKLPGSKAVALADSNNRPDFDAKIERACAIVGTADYCANTVQQLEENISKLVDSSFSPDIDMSREREKFAAAAAQGVHSLVALLDEDLHLSLRKFQETDWTTWPSVGDTSPYVNNITSKLTLTIPGIRKNLSKHHFRFLLDKFGAAFIQTYSSHVYKTDKMSHFGAQQILLDTTTLRSLLIGLSTMGASAPPTQRAPAPTTYVKHITREIAKIEAVLKVILAPAETCIDTYLALVPGGSADAFRHILEMRGVRRGDAAPLVLELTRRLGRGPPTPGGPETAIGEALNRNLQAREKGTIRAPLAPKLAVPGSSPTRPTGPQPLQSPMTEIPAAAVSAAAASAASVSAAAVSGIAGVGEGAMQASEVAVDSMKTFFRGFGNIGTTWKDAGIAEKFGQVSSHIGSSTDKLTKEALSRFGGNNNG